MDLTYERRKEITARGTHRELQGKGNVLFLLFLILMC